MNKNQNTKKKKKGFTLIELIIVLAIMAIIAAIAIPNFTAIRDNSKVKADIQSCETIKRTMLMLVSDGTIKPDGTSAKVAVFKSGNDTSPTYTNLSDTTERSKLMEAVQSVKEPQSKKGVVVNATTGELSEGALTNANAYSVSIATDGKITVTIVNKP
jgi:type IV pilus assembly protein PilA